MLLLILQLVALLISLVGAAAMALVSGTLYDLAAIAAVVGFVGLLIVRCFL
jgi:hypothetical protein